MPPGPTSRPGLPGDAGVAWPQEPLGGRYRVDAELARWASLVVASATDLELERRVSVVACADTAATEEFRAAAARLSSRNDLGMAKVFDLVRDEGDVHVVAGLAHAGPDALTSLAGTEPRPGTGPAAALRAVLVACDGRVPRAGTDDVDDTVETGIQIGMAEIPVPADDPTMVLETPRVDRPDQHDATTALPQPTASPAPVRTAGSEDPTVGRPSPSPRIPRSVVLAFLGGLGAVLVGAVLVNGLGGDDDPAGGGGEGSGGDGGPSVAIADAADHDPFGGGGEHPGDVPLAFDGDPSTRWDTEGYDSATIDIKPGVGMWVAAADASARRVEVDLAIDGVDVTIHALGEAPGGDPDAWGEPVAQQQGASGTVSADLPEGTTHVLVWFTRMAPDGGSNRAGISEIRLLA